ncbi:AAA family ATP:ADP antiporter [Rhizobium leguminosarum]
MTFIQRVTGAKPEEVPALAWSLLYVITIFLAYYVLRPIRDELGIAGGVDNLPWLFTGTMLTMLAASPLFAYAVRRFPRERFIAISYRFFSANLLGFTILLAMASPDQQIWVGRAFFIWVSVFNLFVVSIFWSFIVDIFNGEQGRRLFGVVAAGATLGGLIGSALTSGLIEQVGRTWLLAISIVLIEVGVLASARLSRVSERFETPLRKEDPHQPLGGGIFAGMVHTFRSPYLLGLALFILFYSVTSTFLYFQQASIAAENFADSGARTAFFASIDLYVNAITLILQVFFTGRLMGWLGVAVTLCVLPLVSVVGFGALAAYPTVAAFVAAQVARRVANFAFARPTREVLFTSSVREDRYKAKNFIDTVVYRGGDQVASWSYAGLMGLGVSLAQISVIAVPLSLLWFALSVWLARAHNRREALLVNTRPSLVVSPLAHAHSKLRSMPIQRQE